MTTPKSNKPTTRRRRLPQKHGQAVVDWPRFDTIAQAAAATGIPVAALRMAKRQGSGAFRHSRVDLGAFIRWWFTNQLDDPDKDWGDELKKSQALRETIRLDEDQRRVIDFALVTEFHARLMGGLFGGLERVFLGELPPALRGLNQVQIRARCLVEVNRLKGILGQMMDDWAKKQARGGKGGGRT